jgi:hypothetical protein
MITIHSYFINYTTGSKEWLCVDAMVLLIILLSRSSSVPSRGSNVCGVNFRHVGFRFVLVGTGINATSSLLMTWERDGGTLMSFIVIAGFC